MTFNEYDELVISLNYYANDKRRNEEYRELCRRSAEALRTANSELKNCQAELRQIKGLLCELSKYAEHETLTLKGDFYE